MRKTRIKLSKSTFYIEVICHDTIKELQQITHDTEAVGLYHPSSYVVYPKFKIKPKLGTIHLAKERLGVGYLSHEVLHSVLDWRKKSSYKKTFHNKDHSIEEMMCYYQGEIVKNITNWLIKIKAW